MHLIQGDIITANEAAELLKVHVRTIYKMAQENKIPAVRLGGLWRFRRSELIKFIDSGKNPEAL